MWGALTAPLAVVASDLTGLWWLVLLFGLLVPAVSALQAYWSAGRKALPASLPQDGEGELLGALGELGELTPTTAAMRTGAVVLYGLWDADRRGHNEDQPTPADPAPDGGKRGGGVPDPTRSGGRGGKGSSVTPLVEPLTEREAEVLGLLATGRTNREIASDLFVTVGTVKTHLNNAYRKLDARRRTQAVARGRELGLI